MRVKYFPDTGTALMEFTDNEVAEQGNQREHLRGPRQARQPREHDDRACSHQRAAARVLLSGSPPSITGGGPKHMSAAAVEG